MSTTNMKAPLIPPSGGGNSSMKGAGDPYYMFRDELRMKLEQTKTEFAKWNEILENESTADNSVFDMINSKLKSNLKAVDKNAKEIDLTVNKVANERAKFPHINDEELESRKAFVRDVVAEVQRMNSIITSSKTLRKIEKDKNEALLRRKQAGMNQIDGASGSRVEPVSSYAQNRQVQLQQERENQDEVLGQISSSLQGLNERGKAIHTEIKIQGTMLDEVERDLDSTSGKMEAVLGRLDKALKTDNRCQTYTIVFLVVFLLILMLLVSVGA